MAVNTSLSRWVLQRRVTGTPGCSSLSLFPCLPLLQPPDPLFYHLKDAAQKSRKQDGNEHVGDYERQQSVADKGLDSGPRCLGLDPGFATHWTLCLIFLI